MTLISALKSIKKIIRTIKDIQDMINNIDRLIKQVFPEVLARCLQWGPAIQIPSCLTNITGTITKITNNDLIQTMTQGKSGDILKDITKYTGLLEQVSSGGIGGIFAKVVQSKFDIDDNTFNEFENIIQSLKNASSVLS